MLSFIEYILGYIFPKQNEDKNNGKVDQEEFLAQELLNLELEKEKNQWDSFEKNDDDYSPPNVDCFQRTGVVTYRGETYFLIDGTLFFELSKCSCAINENDKVSYLGYKEEDGAVKVTRILENLGQVWAGEDVATGIHSELAYEVFDHVIIGEVDHRENRLVYMKGREVLVFSLDDVEASFVPLKGDWLELKCSMQRKEENPTEVTAKQVLKVMSVGALRSKVKSAVVTYWNGQDGVCDNKIFFNKHVMQHGSVVAVGSKVYIEAIESNQESCSWRATKMMLHECQNTEPTSDEPVLENDEEKSLQIEKKKNILMTHPLVFQKVQLLGSASLTLEIQNQSRYNYTITKWMVLSRKADSQIRIAPFISRPRSIQPGETVTLYITCEPKFVGQTREVLVIACKGFFMKRFIDINVIDGKESITCTDTDYRNGNLVENMRNVLNKADRNVVPGVRPVKPPAFVPTRLGSFEIPRKVWAAVLGDSEQTVHGNEFNKILNRIETALPCLASSLSIANYTDKWHALMYVEEIQQTISMRAYDIPKTFLTNCAEYLCVEIKGLSERRPSLIAGDKAIAKDIWDKHSQAYEGFIHTVRGELVLMKFSPRFHDTYTGSDVALEFHFSRTVYRRCHQAVNLAITNLGPDLLFPSKVKPRELQVSQDKLNDIKWYNPKLNEGQKAAVTNILLGECRPLPYCIYGPPGTGKTITVIETILQILAFIPDSRILVATPSNSAANLIAERLLAFRDQFSQSMIRLIANHLLQSDTIPEALKPFCATMDIAREHTSKSKYRVNENGININCQTSFIGRHRITIGTCNSLGALAQMGLPQGHFTHVIVDEAGQATEPELMIPLTFTDHRSGQIVLAGDPMQLGPVVMSKYAKEFGLDDTYLTRILERFPYQKDYAAFKEGFDRRLVTKLTFNYRSLEEVLSLPSKMFYDAALVPKINRNETWVENLMDVVTEIFGQGKRQGGIFVCGIRGCNARAEDSPSWFNPQEASMVALTTCKLYKKGVSPDDIGIIAPYIAQIKHLRLIFDAMGLMQPKIGTVEEFQGQERPIILISTVRSTQSYLDMDLKHTLGFVGHSKRLNVALTRAMLAVQVFCNPHLLCKDPLWGKVISQAVEEGKYSGCDLPLQYEKNCPEIPI